MASPANDQTVNFDLDAEATVSDKRPFVVKAKDRSGTEKLITLVDPEDIDWKILMSIENPRQFLSAAMSAEDRTFMRGVDSSGRTFGKLIDAYTRHYGLDSLPNAGGSGF